MVFMFLKCLKKFKNEYETATVYGLQIYVEKMVPEPGRLLFRMKLLRDTTASEILS